MKTDNQYRFNIQFTARSKEEETVGEYLNALGRRKSIFIIATVIEYLHNHPELLSEPNRIHISTISADQLEGRIRAIVEEKLKNLPLDNRNTPGTAAEADQISTDIADMLNDLELFSGF